MSETGEIYAAGKKFTLPPAVAAVTNLTDGKMERWNFETGQVLTLLDDNI